MPEALAVAFITIVCAVVFVVARVKARDPRWNHPSQRRNELAHERRWLEERLSRAERENWGPEMRSLIREQLNAAIKQQAQYAGR